MVRRRIAVIESKTIAHAENSPTLCGDDCDSYIFDFYIVGEDRYGMCRCHRFGFNFDEQDKLYVAPEILINPGSELKRPDQCLKLTGHDECIQCRAEGYRGKDCEDCEVPNE